MLRQSNNQVLRELIYCDSLARQARECKLKSLLLESRWYRPLTTFRGFSRSREVILFCQRRGVFMNELLEKLPAIIGVLVSILSALKSIGFFDMRNKRLERIEKLCVISASLSRNNKESKKNIENVLMKETKVLKEQADRELDPGGLFAMLFMSIVLGFVTYLVILWFISISITSIIGWLLKIVSGIVLFFMIIVDTAAIVAGQKSMFIKKEEA